MDRLGRHPHLTALGAYLALSALATWPLLSHFTTAIAGDAGDPFQTLWGFWWWKHALFVEGRSPLWCDLLRWPHGISLAFQSWDLPSALVALPLWRAVPPLSEVTLYNVAAFASFPLSGFFTYLLCRELWGGWVGGFVAGALHTFGTWHFAHALGHLHLESMQWCPLYFLGLVRTVRRSGPGGPLLGGLALALAATASFYHLLACACGTAALLACWARREPGAILALPPIRRLLLLGAVFLVLTGWLYLAMLRARGAEQYAGAHPSDYFSADLQSFFLPNYASGWSRWIGDYRRWSGNGAENASYLGYVLLALGAMAGLRSRDSRPWLAAGAVGGILSLGPHLHVRGHVFRQVLLPYGWLERAAPPLAFAGCPTRMSWLATFGLTVAAAFTLDGMARRGRRGVALALAVGALGLVEVWPRPQVVASFPAPRFLRDLARDRGQWAVLDASQGTRGLWNQVLHEHPQVGGYVTRAPERLDRFLGDTPVLRPFLGDGVASLPREEAVQALRELRVRFLVVDGERLAQARALSLPLAYEGEGLWIFEVRGGASATP